MDLRKGIRQDNEAASRSRPSEVMTVSISVRDDGRYDLRHLERSRMFDAGQVIRSGVGSRVGIEHTCCPLDAGRDLCEQFQPLAPQRRFHMDEAAKVPSRALQAANEANADRVGNTGNTIGIVRVPAAV